MSTRSAVAVQTGDTWRGRYVHSDGYPTHLTATLHALVARDGLDKVRKVLTEDYYGWSHLSASMPEPVITQADADYSIGSAEYRWQQLSHGYMSDGRFVGVPGYGVAYTTKDNQSSPEEWIEADGDDWGTEWAHLLGQRDILVMKRTYPGTRSGEPTWEIAGRLPYDEPATEQALTRLECGERFQHCGHYAAAHFPQASGLRVSTDTWLGLHPPSLHEATHVVINGVQTVLTGSGRTGSAHNSIYNPIAPRYWWASTEGGEVRLAQNLDHGMRLEHDVVVPTAAGPVVIAAGTITDR